MVTGGCTTIVSVYVLDSFRLSTFEYFSFSRNSVRTGKARVGHVNLSLWDYSVCEFDKFDSYLSKRYKIQPI